jgi:hypothetical protein
MVIVGYFLGIWWAGVEGLALVYGLLTMALLVPGFYFATVGTFVRIGDILRPIMRPVLLAPLCFGAAYGVELATQELPAIVQLTLGIAAGVVPLLLCLLVPAYRRDLSQIVGFVKQVRRPAPATGRPANTTDVDEAAQDDAVVIQEGKGER